MVLLADKKVGHLWAIPIGKYLFGGLIIHLEPCRACTTGKSIIQQQNKKGAANRCVAFSDRKER